jgi:DTW domain-containing protein YfiP
MVRPFSAPADFALIVHPDEVNSTVGTAWILRRSISNLKWIRSNGKSLDQDPNFLDLVDATETVPLLLFPGPRALNLNQASEEDWHYAVPSRRRPLFIVVDGTWTQARSMLRRSSILSSLPRVSFETDRLSEYGFKKQPHPSCLSSVEGVHRVIESLASRGWGPLPALREHDQMITIFKAMARFQIEQEKVRCQVPVECTS